MLREGVLLLAALALAAPGVAQETVRSPDEIVAAAPDSDWVAIAPQDLLVMTLAPDVEGNPRKVVIQLIGAPFSQGWVDNIRTLARADYWDGMAILRVQDNYVVQWGQPDPGMGIEEKPVPDGLKAMSEEDYTLAAGDPRLLRALEKSLNSLGGPSGTYGQTFNHQTPYGVDEGNFLGWPVVYGADRKIWPVHCYGMVGVGRGNPPDAGDGSQLYAVIGHAPRHLDRNLAVVGRVVEGIENLSSLPRGKGPASYYADPAKRVPILSVRIAADLPEGERPQLQYLSTESVSFWDYADARANRRDPFFVKPVGGVDVCNIPVPIRAVAAE